MLTHCARLSDSGFTHLIIDMANVSFIASSGAGALVVLAEQSRAKDGSVQIVDPSGSVTRVLELLNIQQFLALAKDVAEAEANILSSKSK
jgi:anti-anti-sigma factor